MNAGVQSVVESIDAPAVAERRAAALASVAASAPEAADPPAGDAGPGDHAVSAEREQVLAPSRGNGRDSDAELLEIPAFLRRG